MFDVDDDLRVGDFVQALSHRLAGQIHPAINDKLLQHVCALGGDVEYVFHLLPDNGFTIGLELGDGIGIHIVEGGDDLVGELQLWGFLQR